MMRLGAIALALVATGSDAQERRYDPQLEGTVTVALSGRLAIPSAASGGETLADLGQDGLRVLIEPSFGRYAYYVTLRWVPSGCIPRDRARPTGADGARMCRAAHVHVRRNDAASGATALARFHIPREDGDAVLEQLDARLARWQGPNFASTDGTGVSLERVRAGHVRSMRSNSSPQYDIGNPAAQLRGDLLRILLAYGPAGFAPRAEDWHVDPPGADWGGCSPGLAAPLDRGFGAGNSGCDAAKHWPD
ncbi:hypothetical protein [Sphingomonas sp.]|uniref:hypothetical protein n=1 Tax=Sphingomonas sp. TaxID=28214 RepID=UPI0017EFD219|nr:hypothetical protein [Sphingomonas sp.]MBA4760222.1 hypothetical protein [Sphingomonas sp.]